jgi:GT2 family glycosyltransferase
MPEPVPTSSPGSPQVSVVTPLFNCLAATQEMVASLKRTMPRGIAYEVILVDDGSTDGTREWLAGLGEPFRVVLNERNRGFGASTNRGASLARGRVLALLNNDLILKPGWLRPMLNALSFPGGRAGIVGNVQENAATLEVDHAGIEVTMTGKPEHVRQAPRLASLVFRPAPSVFAVTGACMLIKTDTWGRLGGFDEAYTNGCEDVDLCLRARALGLRTVVALRSRVLHHVSASPGRNLHNEENSRRLFLRWRGALAVDASRLWARQQFEQVLPDPRDFPDTLDALLSALYLLRLWPDPPPDASAAADAAIEAELARWREMFSD